MALTAGTVVIGSDGSSAGNGLALEMYALMLAACADDLAGRSGDALVASRKGLAKMANPIAQAVINHITANAVVTVTVGTGTAGLQTIPATIATGQATWAPAAPVSITGSVA